MSRNLFAVFKSLIPTAPLQVGVVTAVSGGVATVELPGGGTLQARGDTTVAAHVFVRDGVIEGPAPTLSVEVIEI